MKAKIERCWRVYTKHWSVSLPDHGKNPFRAGTLLRNQMHFERYVKHILKADVSVEWQEDGGVIVAGVIAFSLT